MQKSPRYEVHTKYGWFSLDEGAYQDYLAGKLWITWPPEKSDKKPVADHVPVNVGSQALVLRERANKEGVCSTVQKISPGMSPLIPYITRMANWGIEELSLSVRSSNGLMRAGMNTFEKLANGLNQDGGLFKIRNLGVKSEKEIRTTFVEECYLRMNQYEKAEYWQQFIDGISPVDVEELGV